jgi:hypothetical protein
MDLADHPLEETGISLATVQRIVRRDWYIRVMAETACRDHNSFQNSFQKTRREGRLQ